MAVNPRIVQNGWPMADAPVLLTTSEVAAMFRVTRNTVTRWCDNGQMTCIHTPSGHRRIPRAEVDKWLVPAALPQPRLVLVDGGAA